MVGVFGHSLGRSGKNSRCGECIISIQKLDPTSQVDAAVSNCLDVWLVVYLRDHWCLRTPYEKRRCGRVLDQDVVN